MVKGKFKGILILFLAFTLILLGFASACISICGNAIMEAGEECDYGSSNGFLCWAPYGNTCQYCTISCRLKTINGGFCGDGIKQVCEECDDGNLINGDGCSSLCKIEKEPPEPPFCGDGVCNGEETCSTCSKDCGICPPPQPICGNGKIETGEECDDGNLVNGDGCSSVCAIEEEEENETRSRGHTIHIDWEQLCEPNWKCSSWSECDNESEIMRRKCTDINNCDFSYNKPAEVSGCEQKVLIKGNQIDYNLLIGLGITLLLLIILAILLIRR